jgi:hypothetical protein
MYEVLYILSKTKKTVGNSMYLPFLPFHYSD